MGVVAAPALLGRVQGIGSAWIRHGESVVDIDIGGFN